MKHQKPKISRLGEQAILLEWDFEIAPENLYWLLSVKKKLRKKLLKSNIEIINTYNSLLINYGLGINVIYDDFLLLKEYNFTSIKTEALETSTYKLPVCYDAEFGLDLDELAATIKLKIPELIALHTQPIYTVYFIGFLPGFLYLGGMDKRLRISRKKEPRKSVAKGAVGIAENQTGIYPNSSPAGWQIIGNCPVEFFNPKLKIPCPFQAGDRIQFYTVDNAEHQRIKTAVDAGSYTLEKAEL